MAQPWKYTLRMRSVARRWGLLAVALLALLLVPFALFESAVLEASERLLRAGTTRLVAISSVSLLLVADVILPVPSSIVATASGMLLGLAEGSFVTWVGLQAGALLGYFLGRSAGFHATIRFVGRTELERASRLHRRWGAVSIIASRAVPVLAESSVVLAGAVRMRLLQFAWLTGVSNAAIALVYGFVGARALETQAFLLALAASIVLPGILMGVHRLFERRGRDALSEARREARSSGAETVG